MTWQAPALTLGWAVLDWIADNLPSPSNPTKSFIPTDEQCRFVLDWYSIYPHTGRYVYRRAVIEQAKGWGKSPLAAALVLAEFAGPVVFSHFDAKGIPQGHRWGEKGTPAPWVQVAAVSEDQTENTYGSLYDMLTANEHRAAKALGSMTGALAYTSSGAPGKLEPVTASAGSREGQRVTAGLLDETHLWTPRNGGVKLARTIRRNAAKMSGRTIETTNSPVLGERSVAEDSGNDATAGEPGILHWANRPSIEPQQDWSDDQLLAQLRVVYGDARWIDIQRLLAEIRDPGTPWTDALRFYFNVRTTGAGRAVDPRRWEELRKPQDVPQGTYIGLGFDGSISQDATVLRACTAEGYSFVIKVWQRPKGVMDWRVDRAEVHQLLAETFARYRVGLMLCDPPKWYTEVQQWAELYGEDRVLFFDTNGTRRFAPAVDRWRTGIAEGSHTHDGDPLTTEHVLASHLRKVRLTDDADDGRTNFVLVKGDDGGRIDGAVADVLAFAAAMTMPPAPPTAELDYFAAIRESPYTDDLGDDDE